MKLIEDIKMGAFNAIRKKKKRKCGGSLSFVRDGTLELLGHFSGNARESEGGKKRLKGHLRSVRENRKK